MSLTPPPQVPASFHSARRRMAFDAQARDSVAPGLRTVDLFVTIDGPGEALYPVGDIFPFPVPFVEKPIIGESFDLDETGVMALTAGNFPTLSVGAHHYRTIERRPGLVHYTGAQIIIVAGGHVGMRMIVHVTFTGIALMNPLGPDGGLT